MNALLESEYDRIYAVCRRIMGNDADAADGCQEALLAIVRGISRFDNRSKFSTWAYRVATNACLDELRRRKRRPLPSESVSDTPVTSQSHDAQTTDRLVLTVALDQLAEDFRLPLVLRDLVGCDYNEIANLLDIPPGTVRSRIARGRRHLSSALGNQTENKSVIEPKRRSKPGRQTT
jgi:RNA polymerase sigma-70 factor (ECF subfamily)